MSDLKTVLLDQFLANANERSWYISFQEAVEGLTDIEAFWKPDHTSHSIAEVVQHLIYWNETWQSRYIKSHVNAVPPVNDNADTFLITEEKTFDELKDQLLRVLLKWQELIDGEQLTSKVNGFPVEAEWWALLSNATTHNAYHIGQMVYIRKMRKNIE